MVGRGTEAQNTRVFVGRKCPPPLRGAGAGIPNDISLFDETVPPPSTSPPMVTTSKMQRSIIRKIVTAEKQTRAWSMRHLVTYL